MSEEYFLDTSEVTEPHDILNATNSHQTSKYLRKQPQAIVNRDYFDPFHGHSVTSQLSSPVRIGSPYLDEYSSVAGQYFKDIIIPRVSSRKSRTRGPIETEKPKEKEYIFQQTSCLPELKLKTTAVRHRKLPPQRTSCHNLHRQQRNAHTTKNSLDPLPTSSLFQNIVIPQSLGLVLYPYSALVRSEAATSILGTNGVGRVIEIRQQSTFNELKVLILNGILCNPSSGTSDHLLSKTEYAQRLKSLRLWSLDPAFSQQQWVQIRTSSDWERVKVLTLMGSRSQVEKLKLMFDEGRSVFSSATLPDGEIGSEAEGDIDDSVTLVTQSPGDLERFDLLNQHPATSETGEQPPPRLRLLSQKPPSQHNSPEKQQKMAKILEQRILLSRI